MFDYHERHSKDKMDALRKKYGSDTEKVVLAVEVIKLGWREANSRIVEFWKALEFAWVSAINSPGKVFSAGRVAFVYGRVGTGPTLRMTSPSGRMLYHSDARATPSRDVALAVILAARGAKNATERREKLLNAVEEVIPGSGFMDDEELSAAITDDAANEIGKLADRRFSTRLSYMSQDSVTRRWGRTETYGGSLAESAAQALSRDLLVRAMDSADKAGFDIVLTVYDEIIAEAALDKTVDDLNHILSTPPKWAGDMPLAADGYQTTEGYRK